MLCVPLRRVHAVEGAGRLFSTSSRPALRAASGRPPARQRLDGNRGAGLTLQARGSQSSAEPCPLVRAWSALGPRSIGIRRSRAGTNGQSRYDRIAGQAPIGAPAWGGGGGRRWVRIPPAPRAGVELAESPVGADAPGRRHSQCGSSTGWSLARDRQPAWPKLGAVAMCNGPGRPVGAVCGPSYPARLCTSQVNPSSCRGRSGRSESCHRAAR
jgi:hypothetical protein